MSKKVKKIIVVDDSLTIRKAFQYHLRSMGYDVTMAESAINALEILNKEKFDLILSDLVMPKLDGYQLLKLIKADKELAHIPVLMLSGLNEMDYVVKCINAGADDYLLKHPLNLSLIKARVGASLERKQLLDELDEERKRSDRILKEILPPSIVEELKEHNYVQPRRHENVAVLFCDIVQFTRFSDTNEPELVMENLQSLMEAFEGLAGYYNVQKIKTIGDSFMAAAGLLVPVENPILTCVEFGLEMVSSVRNLEWKARVGIHYGSVIAGVVGRDAFLYDIFGDTVNVAARIEANGVNGAVNISKKAWDEVSHLCEGESSGLVSLKGKGEMEVFQVKKVKKKS